MKILSITLCNYRSFKNLHKITLGNKNIIVGRNGAGKSNFLKGLFSLFLVDYENTCDNSYVEVEIENKERRICIDADLLVLRVENTAVHNIRINGKSVTRGELQGLLENAGVMPSCFVSQGETLVENWDEMVLRTSGASKFEEFKAQALRLLDLGEIDSLVEKLDYKALKYREFAEKYKKYSELEQERKSIEYEIALIEVEELTREIEKMKVEIKWKSEEEIEYELRGIQEEIKELEFLINREKNVKGIEEGKENDTNSHRKEFSVKQNQLTTVNNKIEELKIQVAAIRYFEAAGTKKEEIPSLISRIEQKKEQLAGRVSAVALVDTQKKLWMHERQLVEDMKSCINKLNRIKNRMPYAGNEKVNLYESIKDVPGVRGPLYELVDVHQKYLPALEAVARSALFYVAVEDESVAEECIRRIKGRMTFVNLSAEGMVEREHKVGTLYRTIVEDKVNRSSIKYPQLLQFLCKEITLFTDITKALAYVKSTGRPAVTLTGELMSRRGVISGGCGNENECLMELMEEKNRCKALEEELRILREELKNLNEEIQLVQGDKNSLINSKAYLKFLQYKLEINTKKKIELPDMETLLRELSQLERNQQNFSLQLGSMEQRIKTEEELNQRVLYRENMKTELLSLREKEALLMKTLLGESQGNDDAGRRNILLEKRAGLMRKYCISKAKCIKSEHDKHELLVKLKCIVNALKPYAGFNFGGRSYEKVLDLEKVRGNLEMMKRDRTLIVEYLDFLQAGKDQKVQNTFSSLAASFREIYLFITGDDAEILWEENKLSLILHKEQVSIKSLSGGQKVIFNLSLLLSIHKLENCPLYVFDEIDANLDKGVAQKIYELIAKTDSQFIISSFKEDSLYCGEKFFGVVSVDKKSEIGEISREVAHETISYNKL